MKILLIEPFYSGSHKAWADGFKKYSSHQIELMTMEGKFWKWRMYGACVTLAEEFKKRSEYPDLILCSDMLDVAGFLALIRKNLPSHIPVVTYFHENQFAYPWQPDSEDIRENRDVHYGMINYKTLLASDRVLFNSEYNRTSFFEGLTKVLGKMPDYHHSVEWEKTEILPLGLELPEIKNFKDGDKLIIKNNKNNLTEDTPLILWNHRWDHDKNPEEFFRILWNLEKRDIPFGLVLLGEQTTTQKKKYAQYTEKLKSRILFSGFSGREDYYYCLLKADILPVTSIHDFFGISIAEAVYYGVRPLLPRRLAYPEIYNPDKNPELFYDNPEDLSENLSAFCLDFKNKKNSREVYKELIEPYQWSSIIKKYDKVINDIFSQRH